MSRRRSCVRFLFECLPWINGYLGECEVGFTRRWVNHRVNRLTSPIHLHSKSYLLLLLLFWWPPNRRSLRGKIYKNQGGSLWNRRKLLFPGTMDQCLLVSMIFKREKYGTPGSLYIYIEYSLIEDKSIFSQEKSFEIDLQLSLEMFSGSWI